MAKASDGKEAGALAAGQGAPGGGPGGKAGAGNAGAGGAGNAGAEGAGNASALYSAQELAEAARQRFGAPPEAVAAALRLAGKGQATAEEAALLLKGFMARKVVH